MFDVGFWELTIIAVVALLVIGPERLPGVARTAGAWMGRGKRFISSVKADIDKELRAEELKRILDEHGKSNPVHEIIEDTKSSLKEIEKTTGDAFDTAKESLEKAEKKNDDASTS